MRVDRFNGILATLKALGHIARYAVTVLPWREIEVAALPKKGMVPRVPRKIRDLLKDLRKAGFTLAPGGKGSHRKFEHPAVKIPAIIPGRDGDDAKAYLERHIAEKINESKS